MVKKVKKSLPWLLILALAAVTVGANFWFSVLKVGANVVTPTTSGVVGNAVPSVSGVNLTDADGGDIGLSANTTTTVYCTSTITDNNGGTDISSCSAVIYRSGVAGGAACTPNNNNCYSVTSGCVLGSAVGNDKNATATAYIYFYADPTDNGTYATAQGWNVQTWQCQLKGIDTQNASSTATDSTPPDMTTLTAIQTGGSITYDTLSPGNNMANLTAVLNATSTGNCPLDIQLKGDNMTYGATGTIAVANQRYSTTTNAAWANGTQLTGTYANLEVSMVKPTSSPSNSTSTVYWGWNVPAGTPMGTYTGINYVNAVED